MSAPSRGRGGVAASRGSNTASRGRGMSRGNATRARGRGRGGSTTSAPANNAGGLLQKLRSGTVQRTPEDGASINPRGRGTTTRGQSGSVTRARGSASKTFNAARSPRSTPPPRTSSPAPASHRDFMAQMNEKFQALKPKRDAERRKAIQDGFLADPEKKTSLANAITPVGTCTDMCPQFERVERIVQNMVDRAEKVTNEASGRDTPSEDRMVKRFRRSAAGYDEQLPSDIRTPETLRRTLDYLLDRIIGGGERLASIHKFVWDRTRGIRNDFSIQQVTKKEDVRIAVDCYERIARFHILSLHQLSNPDNLQEGEHFDAHQEREQLNNTLLSLMYYYDDNRGVIPLPNEPEFRSYCILFELQALTPDLEDRMQTWPIDLLSNPKVQTAFKLYAAAGNTIMDQGPLRPSAPFTLAQANSGKFWTILSSQAVSYVMACVAEMNFSIVRFVALDALWRSGKSAPQGQQARNQDWTLAELQNYLGYDDEEQTLEFCQSFDLAFKNNENGEQCLDFTAVSANALDKSSIPSQQVFSHAIVEDKRCRRTLVAVINGLSVGAAIRQGLVVESSVDDEEHQQADDTGDDQSMFIPEQPTAKTTMPLVFGSSLNPSAANFTPSSSFGQSIAPQHVQPAGSGLGFSQPGSDATQKPMFGIGSFGSVSGVQTPSTQGTSSTAQPISSSQLPFGSSSVFGAGSLTGKPLFQKFDSNDLSPNMTTPSQASTAVSSSPNLTSDQGSEQTVQSPSQTGSTSGFELTQPQKQSPLLGEALGQSIFDRKDNGSLQPSQPSANNIFGQGWQEQQPKLKQAEPDIPSIPTSTPGFAFTQPQPAQRPASPQQHVFAPLSVTTLPPQQSLTAGTASKPLFSFAPATQPSQVLQASTVGSKSLATSEPPSSKLDETSKSGSILKPSISFPKPLPNPISTPSQSQQLPQSSSLPTFEPSTIFQETNKRPQLGGYQIPSVTEAEIESDQPPYKAEATRYPEAERQSSPPTTTRTRHSSPPKPQLSQTPPEPVFTANDRKRLIETTSRLILTQPQGLIEYFISNHVSNLLQTLVKQYLQEQHDEVMNHVRTRHLSRKFFAIWREKTQRMILSKRAKQRRKLLAAAMQAEQDKKLRDEAEMETILAATQETKRIQEEHLKTKEKVAGKQQVGNRKAQAPQVPAQAPQVAGSKRKTTTAHENNRRSLSGTTQHIGPTHKRSRTIDTMSEPSASLRFSTASSNYRPSASGLGTSRFGTSLLGRSTNSADSGRSASHKVDSTRTDYFKLKAMGIDPQTPLIPDTAKSLEARKTRQLEAREALLARSRTRPSMFPTSTVSRSASPAMQPPSRPGSTIAKSSSARTTTTTTTTTTAPGSAASMGPIEEDDYIKQLRQARESLAHDADWFKNQVAVLEKEIEAHEEMHRSQNSGASSSYGSPQVLANGLAMANGYEYLPGESKPGKTLSRTEERIRRTGAHGLATRPIGGSYVPVAMSRQSASRYSSNIQPGTGLTNRKRARGESNSSFDTARHVLQYPAGHSSPALKRAKEHVQLNKTQGRDTNNVFLARSSVNAFAALQDNDEDEDEEEELVEDEEDEEDEEGDQTYPGYQNGTEGDTEDNNEDFYDEEDADEDDEDEQDTRPTHHYPLLVNMPDEEEAYEDDEEDDEEGTPGTWPPQYSRAQSGSSAGLQNGPGASADDALVLSD